MDKWMLVIWAVVWIALSGQSSVGAQTANDVFIQTQMDAVFLIHEDSVTAFYSISYLQPSEMEEVRWVFPIPHNATRVELAPPLLAPVIQNRTDPIIEPPELACELNPTLTYGHGFLPYVEYYPPQDAQLTEFEDGQTALDWAGQAGMITLDDVAIKNSEPRFVGMSITPQTEFPVGEYNEWEAYGVNVSATLRVEYPGTQPYFPVGFHASTLETHLDNYDQNNMMPVTAYVFADMPYDITNYTALHPDLSTITSGSNIIQNIMRDFDGTPIFFNALDPNYYQRLYNAVHDVEGMGFIREFIGELDVSMNTNFRENYPETVDLLEELATYPVMTRFRTFLRDEYELPTPVFEPAPEDEPFQVALEDEVDPAEFYGCSTRTLYDAALEARLPEGRSYLADLQIHVAHPVGWVLSQPRNDLLVLAPEVVDREMLVTVESGGEGPPMFVFQRFEQAFIDGRYGVVLPDNTWQPFSFGNNVMPVSIGARNAFTIYYPSNSTAHAYNNDDPGSAEGVHLAIVTTHEDYAENHALYEDMLSYVATRQFWLSPELRHTLFIDGPDDWIQIGYPEGWIETFDEDGNRLILPERMHPEAAPFIRVRDLPEDWSDFESWVMMAYNPFINPDFFTSDPPIPVPFTRNGRRGFVLRANSNPPRLVEVSVPEDLLETYEDLLQTIAQAIVITEPVEE